MPTNGSRAPVRLNPPLATADQVRPYSFYFGITSDGARALFLFDEAVSDTTHLYSARIDGSAPPLRLNPPSGTGSGNVEDFQLSPDGAYVVYHANSAGLTEILSTPVDGSVAPVKLNVALGVGGQALRFLISPDGSHVIYEANPIGSSSFELYSAPIDGSAPAVKLNGPLLGGGDVIFGDQDSDGPRFSPDGSRVFFRTNQETPLYPTELYSAPVDGSLPAVKLNPSTGVSVSQVEFSASGRAVFQDQDLFSVPADGSQAAVMLNDPGPGSSVFSFIVSDDGRTIVYCADEEVNHRFELFGVAANGGTPPLRLGTVTPMGMGIARTEGYQLDPLGRRVVYTSIVRTIYSVPLDASAPPVSLSPPLPGPYPRVQISPDGATVTFMDFDSLGYSGELVAAPIDGSAPSVRVNGPLVAGGGVRNSGFLSWPAYEFYDSRRIVCTGDQETDEVVELFASFLAPTLSGVTPNRGPARGGNTCTLTGCNLAATTEVYFDGRPATSVKVVSPTELRVVVPRGPRLPPPTLGPASGKTRQAIIHERTVDVTVTEEGTLDTLSAAYTYYPGDSRD